jgi:hypothetical protein
VLAGCSALDERTAEIVAPGFLDAPPSTHDAAELTRLLAGRVVVARLTDSRSENGVRGSDVVFYRPDGIALLSTTAASGLVLQRQASWTVKTRRLSDESLYSFIAIDDAEDGATVQFDEAAGWLMFSDVELGAFFSYGVLQSCWPQSRPAVPGVEICNAAEEAALGGKLAQAHRLARGLRETDFATAAANGPAILTTAPGSVFENSYGNKVIVTRVQGHEIEFRNQRGQKFVSHALLYSVNPRVLGNEDVIAAVDALWPLEEGKHVSAWVYNSDWLWELSWRVVGRESVSVPAGTFDAWIIEHTERSLGDGYVYRAQIWYAPAIGWNVHYRGQVVTPPSPLIEEWTLTRAVATGARRS